MYGLKRINCFYFIHKLKVNLTKYSYQFLIYNNLIFVRRCRKAKLVLFCDSHFFSQINKNTHILLQKSSNFKSNLKKKPNKSNSILRFIKNIKFLKNKFRLCKLKDLKFSCKKNILRNILFFPMLNLY